ncbi:hypothetical protein DXG01_009661 [Tephrocybe rancida]|nr:hypothetical protein DXG01_009661 [Tephrocybe rancida]
MASSTSLIVQCFFAWRVWKISQKRNPYLPGFICTMSLLQWSVLVWVGVEWSTHRSFADLGRVLPIAYSWLISSAVADLSITASMVYYLGIRLRGQAMRTKGAFKVIISRTIQANVLSLASQIGIFALFMSNVGLYFFLNDFTVVKVYAFSLIVSLITRKGAYATHNTSETSATPRPTGISLTHLSSADFRGGARSAPNISINVR